MDLYAASVEYARITVTADTPLDGTVAVALLAPGDNPTAGTTWHAAEWTGAAATTRTCRLLVAGTAADAPAGAVRLADGEHNAWLRLGDSPEQIIRKAPAFVAVH